VEITESAVMVDPGRALALLTRLHQTGVRIAIDDFGTGYSSLAYLKRLPIDEIKIDKSFVLDMPVHDGAATIARSVIDLGHNLGLVVVAEGVETRDLWDQLAAMRCDVAQGYYLSRPIPAAELTRRARSLPRLLQKAS
jgi:EAL domain-containing protein (putative c-di-GMP-specific phosphodiesterase class I)